MSQANENHNQVESKYNSKDILFNVHSIYVKDLSFEAPHSPLIFNEEWKPKIDFNIQIGSQILSAPEYIYEVILHITVKVKIGEGEQEKTAFLIEVKQAGAFTVKNVSSDMLQQLLSTECATVLFPYAREIISTQASRGGFPQFLLPPMDFNILYAQHIASQANSKESITS